MAELSDFKFLGYFADPTLSDEELLTKFEKYPEFNKVNPGIHLHPPNVIRYIILMYDMNSEMKEYWPNIGERKRECALMSGFKLNDQGIFHETVEEMLIGNNPMVNAMCVRYIRLFENPYYPTYVTIWNLLNTEIANSFEPQESKNIASIQNNITKLNKQISEYSKMLFQGDDMIALKKALYANMERENLGLRPEEIATAIARGSFKPTEGLF